MAMISRSNAEALIPQQVADEIIQNLPTASIFLSLARQLPKMTSKQTKIPVLTGLASASFVSGDSGRKQTSNLSWDGVYITAEELAVIVPIPEAVLDDSNYDIWSEVRPRITEAFGRAIDSAAFFGTNKPDTWPAGLVPAAVDAGNVISFDPNEPFDLYGGIMDENGLIALVEEKGLPVNGYVGALQLRAKLRGARDANGQPIFRSAYSNGAAGAMTYELDGTPIVFPANGSWDARSAYLLAGSFESACYALRQDITFRVFDQGTITDGDGKVALSLMENDCVALRAVMRIGWALPKPVNPVSGVSYYPFSVLRAETLTKIGSAQYKVTAPAKAATPQTTHESGVGYTAEISWSPSASAFAASTEYTATVVLTAADGYAFARDFNAGDVVGLPKTTSAGAASKTSVVRNSNAKVTIEVVYKATAA